MKTNRFGRWYFKMAIMKWFQWPGGMMNERKSSIITSLCQHESVAKQMQTDRVYFKRTNRSSRNLKWIPWNVSVCYPNWNGIVHYFDHVIDASSTHFFTIFLSGQSSCHCHLSYLIFNKHRGSAGESPPLLSQEWQYFSKKCYIILETPLKKS